MASKLVSVNVGVIPRLATSHNAALRIVAVTNSRRMLLSKQPLQPQHIRDWPENKQLGQPTDLAALGAHMASSSADCKVLVDCTANDDAPDQYAQWMAAGVDVVTPNKKMGSGSLARYEQLRSVQRDTGRHFLCEATVGAGLPLISTLSSLLATGDQVLKIEGVLSGTLSYLFNTYSSGDKWSDVVARAKALGYTEPDPRDDLSGTDVARKVTILARQCGMAVELEKLQVDSLVPQELRGCATADEFMSRLPEFDQEMATRAKEAEAAGEVLRYVGVVDVAAGTCSVSLKRYAREHPLAALNGSDNMVAFTTSRYKAEQPLIVRGPGAGAEVTAGGVFADIVQLVRCYGGPSW